MENQEKRPIVCWTCNPDDEYLHSSEEEAIDAFLVDCEGHCPDKLTVYEYARMEPCICTDIVGELIDRLAAEDGIDDYDVSVRLAETLDEELGDPDGDNNIEPSEALIEAETVLKATVAAEFERCEASGKECPNAVTDAAQKVYEKAFLDWYTCWACEQVGEHEVDLRHRPHG